MNVREKLAELGINPNEVLLAEVANIVTPGLPADEEVARIQAWFVGGALEIQVLPPAESGDIGRRQDRERKALLRSQATERAAGRLNV
jgi:hypothetical protein